MAWKLRKDKLKSDELEAQDPAASLSASEPSPAEQTPTAFERVGPPLGYDLSANVAPAFEPAFMPESMEEPQFLEDALPQFTDENLPRFSEDTSSFDSPSELPELSAAPVEDEPVTFNDTRTGAPIDLDQPEEPEEREPISLGAFAPYQPPSLPNPVADLEPLPEFDPSVAPSTPDLEPEAIAVAPPIFTPVEEAIAPAEEPLTFAEEEEDIPAIAPFDVSPEREAAAPGLVTTESDTGMPRVAPFILDAPEAASPSEAERMHHVVLRLGNLSASYILVKNVTTIGRPDSAVQNYPDIEVELDDGVSRRHAEIRQQNNQFYVVDMGSTNGTILNGEMLSPEQPVPLHTGDRIRIGERTEMLFE